MEKISVRKLDHANLHIQCESGTAQELNEFFSFYVPGYRFMPAYRNRVWDGKIRLYNRNTGELPAGLIHHLVQFSRSRDYIINPIKTNYGLPYEEDKIDGRDIATFHLKKKESMHFRDYKKYVIKNLFP